MDRLDHFVTETEIVNALKKGFENIFNINFKSKNLTLEEKNHIQILKEEKYLNPKWLNKYS